MIVRALLSVYDKTGLDDFARGLTGLGVELLASGGTSTSLDEHGISHVRIDSVTEFPELLGGRVKTLHPRIHAGILARRDDSDDMASLAELGIAPIDLVCVNLYPFDEVAWRKGTREEEAVEMIDIGGPTLLRAAAKNFVHVAPVCSPEQYQWVIAELSEKGELSLATRRALAAETFAYTAAYEASIMNWFSDRESFPGTARRVAREGARPRLRRESPSACGLLRGAGHAPPSALSGRAARREGALLQQPERSRRLPVRCSRSSRSRPA